MSDIERLIGQLDPQSAQFATAALDWLLPQGGDLSELTQLELQDFLWLQLPASWPVPIGLQLEVAQALADLFAECVGVGGNGRGSSSGCGGSGCQLSQAASSVSASGVT